MANTDWKMPILARDHSNYLHELQETWNKEPPTRRIRKGQKETRVHMSYQHLRILHAGILLPEDAGATRKDFEWRWLATDNPEINPITINPRLQGATLRIPLTLLFPLPRPPFPRKSLASSSPVCPLTIHFCMLDKSPLSGPRRGSSPVTVFLIQIICRKAIAINSKSFARDFVFKLQN